MVKYKGWRGMVGGVVLLCLVVGLAGCGREAGASEGSWAGQATESFIAVATRGRININAETGNVDFWDSTQKKAIRVLKKIPDGFPQEFPIYPGAKLLSGILEDDSSVMMVSFEVDDGFERVKDYYDRKLEQKGWEWEYIKEEVGELSIFVYKKPFSGTVWLNDVGKKVRVDVTLEN